MRLRKYCVVVMDNWTPLRHFWTAKKALKFAAKHSQCSYVWIWDNKKQEWIKPHPLIWFYIRGDSWNYDDV